MQNVKAHSFGTNSIAMDDQEDIFEDAQMTATPTQLQTPLSSMARAFEELSEFLGARQKGQELRLDTFCEACSLVSVLFNSLGLAFKFAELEYCAKVRDLVEASKKVGTLQNILDQDVANDSVKTPGSHSRNLRRVRQGLDLIRALFEQFLTNNENSLKDAASTAYGQVCAPYHSWAVRTAVYAGMCTLPSRDQLLQRLHETDNSAEKRMRRYINASRAVINYIDKLFISRDIGLDW